MNYVSALRRGRQLGFVAADVFGVVNTALNVAGQGWQAYTQYSQLQQQEDQLRLQRQKLASEQAALQAAKENAERLAQEAMLQDQEAASAGIAAAYAAEQGVPTWVWVAGVGAIALGAIVFAKSRGRRRR